MSFGCIVPETPERFSDMYREGERVAVYLKNSGDGWSTLQMNHLTGEHEPQWRARVQAFLNVLLASEADDPEQRYAELLEPELRNADQLGANRLRKGSSSISNVKTIPRSGLSDASYYGLLYNPDPRAAKSLRKPLLALVLFGSKSAEGAGLPGANRDGKPGKPTGIGTGIDAIESSKSPAGEAAKFADGKGARFLFSREDRVARYQATHQLVTLLAKMHDARSVRPVMTYTAMLSESERVSFIQVLPELCWDADASLSPEPTFRTRSRYIRKLQSRRSLLIWKIFGQRLDGWSNWVCDRWAQREDEKFSGGLFTHDA